MQKLSVIKIGGSLIDQKGKNIPKILKQIKEIKDRSDVGPIVVFSAPSGHTDMLINICETKKRFKPNPTSPLFKNYVYIAKKFTEGKLLTDLLKEIDKYRKETDEAISSINIRFHGNNKAKILTHGGELPTALLMSYIMKNNGLDSCILTKAQWPIITDDNFENATPLYNKSKKRLKKLVKYLEEGKIISQAGFLGITEDGLETILGRGGSDLTAVFTSYLLRGKYNVETTLFKDTAIQSADPKKIKDQKTRYIKTLTYNEAHKASMMGMKIVQDVAVSIARKAKQKIKIVPINKPEKFTVIQAKNNIDDTVKCVTGKKNCAILSINDEKSRSLEDALIIWENYKGLIDLGVETLDTGKRIRDLLFLDSNFLRKNEEKVLDFDEKIEIEYNVGVVTIIGDQMKNSSGIASRAIGGIPEINIKRGIFAPHTSLIILVVDEENVNDTVASIHKSIINSK